MFRQIHLYTAAPAGARHKKSSLFRLLFIFRIPGRFLTGSSGPSQYAVVTPQVIESI
jgi:hypothetical protein